jgi:type III pantothenate kinase
MKVDVVVDVGNTRIKWGRCVNGAVVESVSLPPDLESVWQEQREWWRLPTSLTWALSSVHPQRCNDLADWLRRKGETVWLLERWQQLPLEVAVEYPERVGLDRLLNAVAAKSQVPRSVPIFVIDAGSAVTVDCVDPSGAFVGGAIFPGLRLMAQALHEHTAQLPLVQIATSCPPALGKNTERAIEAGVFWAVAGGIKVLLRQMLGRVNSRRQEEIFLTGGDASLLADALEATVHLWPTMTLEGLRLTAEAQP